MHGITPNEAKEKGVLLKAYAPISFQVSIKGASIMDYKMEEKNAFRIIGAKLSTSMENGACYKEIPAFWGACAASGKIGQLAKAIKKEPYGMLGVSACGDESLNEDTKFDYYIAAASDEKAPEGMEEFIVPAATWAIFPCKGPMPQTIQELQKRITTEWLPSSGYEYGNAPDIEVYYDEDSLKPDARCEVWIPVVKKA